MMVNVTSVSDNGEKEERKKVIQLPSKNNVAIQ